MNATNVTERDLEALARSLGVVRGKRFVVKCSGCHIGCFAVEPQGLFCVRCYAKRKRPTSDQPIPEKP